MKIKFLTGLLIAVVGFSGINSVMAAKDSGRSTEDTMIVVGGSVALSIALFVVYDKWIASSVKPEEVTGMKNDIKDIKAQLANLPAAGGVAFDSAAFLNSPEFKAAIGQPGTPGTPGAPGTPAATGQLNDSQIAAVDRIVKNPHVYQIAKQLQDMATQRGHADVGALLTQMADGAVQAQQALANSTAMGNRLNVIVGQLNNLPNALDPAAGAHANFAALAAALDHFVYPGGGPGGAAPGRVAGGPRLNFN